MAEYIEADTIYHAHKKAMELVLEQGDNILDERGSNTREVQNLFIQINNPRNSINKHHYWQGDKLDIYKDQLVNPKNPGFVYTYGERLRLHRGFFIDKDGEAVEIAIFIDQISNIVDQLIDCKETRRATAVTWSPELDSGKEEVPCLILVDFKIRDSKLDITAVWRSHDIYGAYYPNLIGLRALGEFVCKRVGVGMGKIVTQSISAHIYEANWEEAWNEVQ